MKLFISVTFILLISVCCTPEESQSHEEQDQQKELLKTTTYPKANVATYVNKPKAYETAHNVVDEMPLFGGCTSKKCSDEKLIRYIQNSLEYPASAKEAGIEGRVFVQFIIQIDGSVSDVHIVRDIGSGAGEEAARVVQEINELGQRWTAGILDGVQVPVLFTLPVSFVLE